ncbi:MAG: S-methyl-5-thioribose-1-phosphate isomerase, partial [Nitrospirae bacterium]
MVKAVEWKEDCVRILDQSKLPQEVTYIDCTNHLMVADTIKTLKIRGAPAIGIAAAMGLARSAMDVKAKSYEEFL